MVFANPYILPGQTYNNNRLDMKDYATVESDDTNPFSTSTRFVITLTGGEIKH